MTNARHWLILLALLASMATVVAAEPPAMAVAVPPRLSPRAGIPFPVTVQLTCDQPSFRGTIMAGFGQPARQTAEREVQLNQGSYRYWLYPYGTGDWAAELVVELRAATGEVVRRQAIGFEAFPSEADWTIGQVAPAERRLNAASLAPLILSEEQVLAGWGPIGFRQLAAGTPSRLERLQADWLEGVYAGRSPILRFASVQQPLTVVFQPATLPDRWCGYLSLDALWWDGVFPTSLSPAQGAAIAEWVRQGGWLVVAMPPAKQTTYLPPALPAPPAEASEGPVYRRFGLGQIVYLRRTPDALPALGRDELLRLFGCQPDTTLGEGDFGSLTRQSSDYAWLSKAEQIAMSMTNRFLNAGGLAETSLQNMGDLLASQGQRLPLSRKQLWWLVLAYVAVLVLVEPLLLRRFRRQRWTWLTWPLIIALFTGIAWYQVSPRRVGSALPVFVTIVDADEATGTMRRMDIGGLHLRRGGWATVETPDGGTGFDWLPPRSGSAGASRQRELTGLDGAPQLQVSNVAGTFNVIGRQWPTTEGEPLPFTTDLRLAGGRIVGTIEPTEAWRGYGIQLLYRGEVYRWQGDRQGVFTSEYGWSSSSLNESERMVDQLWLHLLGAGVAAMSPVPKPVSFAHFDWRSTVPVLAGRQGEGILIAVAHVTDETGGRRTVTALAVRQRVPIREARP